MNSTKMFDAMSKIDDNLVERCINDNNETTDQQVTSQNQLSKKTRFFKLGVVIASFVLILAIGSVTVVLAAEAKEYNDAVAFFEENGLSTEGLSRTEVKAVYLDIKTNSFSYGKTATVIQNAIPGWEIQQDNPTPTPEELEYWFKNYVKNMLIKQNGISYQTTRNTSGTFSILECYNDGKMIWNVELSEFTIYGYLRAKNETIVWGHNVDKTNKTEWIYSCFIALVDDSGNVKWQRCLDHGFHIERIASILKNSDGTWSAFSIGDSEYLCYSCYDNDGNELSVHKTEVGDVGIWNVTKLGDGYIIQLGNTKSHDNAHLYKMNRDGNLTDDFTYESDGYWYYIQDLIEFEGKIIISAYYVPINEGLRSSRSEIANILDYCLEREDPTEDIPSEELTPIVCRNFTAVLLICDPENGLLRTFYSVKGSLGADLSIENSGELEWTVKSFVSTHFSPYTSAHTISGKCKDFHYVFDSEGKLKGQIDTNTYSYYLR